MLKKLRRQFITIAMISVSVVLIAIVASINIANYISTNQMLDARLELIAENGGTFPEFNENSPKDGSNDGAGPGEGTGEDVVALDSKTGSAGAEADGSDTQDEAPPKPPGDMPEDLRNKGISEESQFDTRYFTVTIDSDGNVTSVDTGKIAAVSSDTASEYARKLWNDGKSEGGFISCYKYCTIIQDDATMYIFLDAQRELSTVRTYILASAGISLLGLMVVFGLICFFSGRVLKPVSESYAKQRRFITDASHEIKTPLTIIDANTEVIEMMDGENEWTESTRKQIKRLTALTEKLVFLSRMEEADSKLVMSEFSLTDAVLDTAEPFKAIAASKSKSLEIRVDENMRYTGDEKTIRQLVSLLLDNAMKYSSKEGNIRISAEISGKNRIITVWNTVDENSGIEKGRLDYLFERFYRTDKSRSSKTGGFGIGLSVAYAITEAHKGKISAKSDDGHSITFTVVL